MYLLMHEYTHECSTGKCLKKFNYHRVKERGNVEKEPEYLYVKRFLLLREREKMEKLCPRCRKFLLACIDFN